MTVDPSSAQGAEPLPRVTILTADSGGGHRVAAQSLADALEARAYVSSLNLLDEYAPFPLNTLSGLYGPCVTHAPWLYRMIYRYASARERWVRMLRTAYPFVRRTVTAPLLAQEPDLIISVHPLQIDIPIWVLRAAGLSTPLVTVVTDPVTPPVAWFSPDSGLCIVATEPARQTALACGLAPEQVQVIGLPVRRAFLAARGRSKPAARAMIRLIEDRPLVLLTGGGAGIGRIRSMAHAIGERLAGHPARPQLAIVAGRNRRLQRRLQAEDWPLPVRVLGFVEDMADWLAAADLLITKAGPGTLAEAACLGVPALITGCIDGQETGNVSWVTQHGAGSYESHPAGIASLADELLQPGNPLLGQMGARARELSRPDAAADIVQAALRMVRSAAARNQVASNRI